MRTATWLKLGQIAGALLMAAGVAACTLRSDAMPGLFILGVALYGGCRLAAWLRKRD